MKHLKLLLAALVVVSSFAFLSEFATVKASQEPKEPKVNICHKTPNHWEAIEVDSSAFDGEGINDHTQHGDFLYNGPLKNGKPDDNGQGSPGRLWCEQNAPQTDLCTNIDDIQTIVPEGKYRTENGQCLDKTKVCTNPAATNYDSEVSSTEIADNSVCKFAEDPKKLVCNSTCRPGGVLSSANGQVADQCTIDLGAGYSCVNVGEGESRCRLTANPTDNQCKAPVDPCIANPQLPECTDTDPDPTPTPTPTVTPSVTPSPVPQNNDLRMTFNCTDKRWNAEVVLKKNGVAVNNAKIDYQFYGKEETRYSDANGINNFGFNDEGKGMLKVYIDSFNGHEVELNAPSCTANAGEPQSMTVRGRVLGASTEPLVYADTGSASALSAQVAFILSVIASGVAYNFARRSQNA